MMEQLRVGAEHNYLVHFYLLTIIPLCIGIQALTNKPGWKSANGALKISLLLACTIAAIQSIGLPVNVFFNQRKTYPFHEVRNYIDARNPSSKIYSRDDSVLVHLADRTLMLPWFDRSLEAGITHFRPLMAPVKEVMDQTSIDWAIMLGSNCQNWRPFGLFANSINQLDKLEKQFGKMCLFGKSIE